MPDTQPQFTLRQLAADYADNRISMSIYRERRSQLLERLANTSEQLVQQTAAPAVTKRPASQGFNKLLLIMPLLLLLMVAGWFILAPHEDGTTADEKRADKIDNADSVVLEGAIKQFMDHNNWSRSERERLLKQWQGFDAKTHSAVRHSQSFRIFMADLRTLIKEERSLSNGELSSEANALIEFSKQLESAN